MNVRNTETGEEKRTGPQTKWSLVRKNSVVPGGHGVIIVGMLYSFTMTTVFSPTALLFLCGRG